MYGRRGPRLDGEQVSWPELDDALVDRSCAAVEDDLALKTVQAYRLGVTPGGCCPVRDEVEGRQRAARVGDGDVEERLLPGDLDDLDVSGNVLDTTQGEALAGEEENAWA